MLLGTSSAIIEMKNVVALVTKSVTLNEIFKKLTYIFIAFFRLLNLEKLVEGMSNPPQEISWKGKLFKPSFLIGFCSRRLLKI